MHKIDDNLNIISRGAEDVSLSNVTLGYLINRMGVVNPVEKSEYDIEFANIDLNKIDIATVDVDALKAVVNVPEINSIYNIGDIKLTNIIPCGINFEDKFDSDTSENEISVYRSFNKFINTVNEYVEYDKIKEQRELKQWKDNKNNNDVFRKENLVDDRCYLPRIIDIDKNIERYLKKILKLKSKKKANDEKTLALINDCYYYAINNFKNNTVDKSLNFGIGLFIKFGFHLDERIDYRRIHDHEYLVELLNEYELFFNIWNKFFKDFIALCKEKHIKKMNDCFNLDIHHAKVYSLNSINELDQYDKKYALNLYLMYDAFKYSMEYSLNKIFKEYVKRVKKITDISNYFPIPAIAICFIVSLCLTLTYNFTLLKEIWERNNLLYIYLIIFVFAILILYNLIINIKKYKKLKSDNNVKIKTVSKTRKNSSIFSIVLYLAITIVLFSLNIFFIFRYDGYDNNFYYVNASDGTIIIDGLVSDNKEYLLPEQIDNKNISRISNKTFRNNSKISKVDMSKTNATIDEKAFSDCDSLKEVYLPENITALEDNTFIDCRSLGYLYNTTNLIKIDDSCFENCTVLDNLDFSNLQSLGEKAFKNSGLSEIVLGNALENIGDEAFYGCRILHKIALPTNTKTIGKSAFEGCDFLKEIIFPENVEKISSRAFYGCYTLTSIKINNFDIFDGLLLEDVFGFDGKKEKCYSFYVDEGSCIPDNFFKGTKLEYCEFSNNITKIGNSAFKDCTDLTFCIFGTDSLSVGEKAFYNCSKLLDIDFIDEIEDSIPDYCFYNCKINNIVLNNSIKNLGNACFSGSGIYYLKLNEGLQNIGEKAFEKNSITTVELPSTIMKIGDKAFDQNQLESVSLNFFESLGSVNRIFDTDVLTNIKLTGTSNIPYGLFQNCKNLKHLTLDNHPTTIGDYAFYNCDKFEDYSLFENVTQIGDFSFALSNIDNNKFSQFKNIEKIGDDAFFECNIDGLLVIPKSVTNLGSGAFKNNLINGIKIEGSIQDVGHAPFENNYINTLNISDNLTNSKLLFDGLNITSIDLKIVNGDKTLQDIIGDTISSIQTINVFNNSETIIDSMFANCNLLNYISFEYPLHQIGPHAFENCYNLNVNFVDDVYKFDEACFSNSQCEGLTFSSNVKYIGKNAFNNTNISYVVLPKGIEYIGEKAFGNNTISNLTMPIANVNNILDVIDNNLVYMAATIKLIGTDAIPDKFFEGLTNLTSFDFNNYTKIGSYAFSKTEIVDADLSTINKLGEGAFADCEQLKNVILNVEEVPTKCFENCKSLVGLGDNYKIKKVNDYAFNNCKCLSFNMTEDLESVGDSAFKNCTYVKIDLPANLKIIGTEAFKGCTLSSVLYLDNASLTIGEHAFENLHFDYDYNELVITQNLGHNIQYYIGSDISKYKKVIIKNAKNINKEYFDGLQDVSTIQIMGNATQVDGNTFKNFNISNISLPDSVRTIGESAFEGCRNLINITLPKKLQRIERYAFKDSLLYGVIVLPMDIRYIGKEAFGPNTRFTDESVKKQHFINAWDLNWDSQSNANRFFNKLGYWAINKPAEFYSTIVAIVLAIIGISCGISYLVHKKKGR